MRPNSAVLGKLPKCSNSYIRYGSRSIIAKGENHQSLIELTARILFDDRINRQATINDFDLGLIQAFLQEVKSSLYEESQKMFLAEIARNMHLAKGPDEDLHPVNVGLLFFNRTLEKFFSRAWIELVVHQDESGRSFKEHYFKRLLHIQLRNCLSFLKTNIIHEHIIKVPHQAEAIRFHNFPYEAVEEALSNAVYHKSYEIGNLIGVQVWPDKIEILSFPGPIPPVGAQILSHQKRIVARDYRNRRIGDFLKELELTEGRGTGFPTIYRAMSDNGSPDPVFDTDDQSTYFLTVLPAFNENSNGAGNGYNLLLFNDLTQLVAFSNGAVKPANTILDENVHHRVKEMLTILSSRVTRQELFKAMNLTNQSKNRAKYLDPLIDLGWVRQDHPEEKTNPNQRYQITDAGERVLAILT